MKEALSDSSPSQHGAGRRLNRAITGILLLAGIIMSIPPVSAISGTSWTEATSSAGFIPREFTNMVAFHDKLWVIGGLDQSNNSNNYYNDVWFSQDGKSWAQATGSATFSPRYGHTFVVFKDKMWVIGGEIREHPWVYANDVWYSSDGMRWVQATGSAGFSPRIGHAVITYDNKMWVIAGVGDAYGNVRFNDVWCSADGVAWKQVTGFAPFSPRYDTEALTYDNRIWLIGGDDGAYESDVWSTRDGYTWYQAIGSAGFPPRSEFSLAVFNDKMWIAAGGYSADGGKHLLNDVWFSS